MATKKAKTNRTSGGTKATTKTAKTAEKATVTAPVSEAKVVTAKPAAKSGATNAVKRFFRKKYEGDEGVLTVFKTPKIIGAISGEVVGAFLLTTLFLALGFYQPLYLMFALVGITIAVYPLSGANINPIVTIGLMATRRISVIRGVFYIIAQLIGAMLAWLMMQGFVGGAGELAPTLTKLAAITENSNLWGIVAIEALGAAIIGFFFARALKFKKSTWTFASVVGAGFVAASLIAIVISSNFFQAEGIFALNPAIAIALEAFSAKDTNGAQALLSYVVAPAVAGIIGFYLSDLTSQAAGDATDN